MPDNAEVTGAAVTVNCRASSNGAESHRFTTVHLRVQNLSDPGQYFNIMPTQTFPSDFCARSSTSENKDFAWATFDAFPGQAAKELDFGVMMQGTSSDCDASLGLQDCGWFVNGVYLTLTYTVPPLTTTGTMGTTGTTGTTGLGSIVTTSSSAAGTSSTGLQTTTGMTTGGSNIGTTAVAQNSSPSPSAGEGDALILIILGVSVAGAILVESDSLPGYGPVPGVENDPLPPA